MESPRSSALTAKSSSGVFVKLQLHKKNSLLKSQPFAFSISCWDLLQKLFMLKKMRVAKLGLVFVLVVVVVFPGPSVDSPFGCLC